MFQKDLVEVVRQLALLSVAHSPSAQLLVALLQMVF
jgi:hypothetical protein